MVKEVLTKISNKLEINSANDFLSNKKRFEKKCQLLITCIYA